jgi:AbrB family looped-hinge helix DNA binding protein
MNTTGKIQNKGQVTIPTSVRRQAGLSKGDLVNFVFRGGKIIITPTVVIDRSKFPTADDEYTPAQRKIIDAQLAKGMEDIKAGRVSKAFSSAEEFSADLHKATRRPPTISRSNSATPPGSRSLPRPKACLQNKN